MTSKCARSESVEYIARAKETGFAGMVFTNHFYRGNTAIDRDISWKEFVEFYKRDWLLAKEEGDKQDIDVIFGVEEHYGNGKECLIYGVTADVIAECTDFPKMPIDELSSFVRTNGGFIVCAHPFRNREYITDSDAEPDMRYFDAVEVWNRGNDTEANDKAAEFVKKHGYAVIAGGDVHSTDVFGNSGIILPERVHDTKALAEALKAGKQKIFIR